jgi:hypothetical protein
VFHGDCKPGAAIPDLRIVTDAIALKNLLIGTCFLIPRF